MDAIAHGFNDTALVSAHDVTELGKMSSHQRPNDACSRLVD
jgi:hypothetical protein